MSERLRQTQDERQNKSPCNVVYESLHAPTVSLAVCYNGSDILQLVCLEGFTSIYSGKVEAHWMHSSCAVTQRKGKTPLIWYISVATIQFFTLNQEL